MVSECGGKSSPHSNKGVKGIRPDYYNGKTIFELKPFNPKSAKAGVKQLRKYNTLLGGGKIMRLEFYQEEL